MPRVSSGRRFGTKHDHRRRHGIVSLTLEQTRVEEAGAPVQSTLEQAGLGKVEAVQAEAVKFGAPGSVQVLLSVAMG